VKARVAIFAPGLVTGGTQRHLQQVLEGLDRRRFEPVVYSLKLGGEVAEELGAAGVTVRFVPLEGRLASLETVRVVRRVAGELRADAVRVVHGYQWRPALVGAVAARLAGVPIVLASKRSLSGDSRSERRAWRLLGRLVDTITVNADALRVEAVGHGVRSDWAVVRNGIDLERFTVDVDSVAEARRAVGLDPDRPVVGTVGRLDARKGHDDLLRAIERLGACGPAALPQLVLVGGGPERAALESLAAELEVAEAVRFVGTVTDVRPWLAAMDAFVLPSREEGSSNAALEAMACGRPVVATSVGGTEELIEDGRTGLLVPPRDPAALATALATVLEAPEYAARLGTAARAVVEERYGVARMVREIEALWEDLLARHGHQGWGVAEEARSA
jgi:glycosyltransferase involved in cell wall biosynthesis